MQEEALPPFLFSKEDWCTTTTSDTTKIDAEKITVVPTDVSGIGVTFAEDRPTSGEVGDDDGFGTYFHYDNHKPQEIRKETAKITT